MTIVTWFTLFLLAVLITASFIDIREQRIPNISNAVLALGGVIFWYVTDFQRLLPQLASGAAFGLALWLIRQVHVQMTGRVGLGLGDVKMGGAAAIWISPLSLPMFLFISSLTGLAFALIKGGVAFKERIAFGPFLAIGFMSSWLVENMR
jgi:leader peptidase (prepilin peptidase) / N-methyltransferase